MNPDRRDSVIAVLMGTAGKALIVFTWAMTAIVLLVKGEGLLALVTFFVPPVLVGTVFVAGSPLLVITGVVGAVAFMVSFLLESLAQRKVDRALDRRWERAARAKHIEAIERELGIDSSHGDQL